MHPGFIAWWKHHHHEDDCCATARCGPGGGSSCGPRAHRRHGHWHGGHDDDVGAGMGVRRPLRFLAHKLDLDEDQVGKLAAILNALKTERAQAAVDQRRRVSALADAVEAESFDEDKLEQASTAHVESAERTKAAVATAVRAIHAILNEEQRKQFAYLLRTGALSM